MVFLLLVSVLCRTSLKDLYVANARFLTLALGESHYPTIDEWSGDTTNHVRATVSYERVFADLYTRAKTTSTQPTLTTSIQICLALYRRLRTA